MVLLVALAVSGCQMPTPIAPTAPGPLPTYTPVVVIITATPEPASPTPTPTVVQPTLVPSPTPTSPPVPTPVGPTPPPLPTPVKPQQRPTASITSPPQNAQYNVNTPITVKFNAASEDGVSVSELYVGQTRVGRHEYDQYPSRLTDSLVWTPGTAGSYNLSVVVYDSQYTPSNSAKITVQVVRQVTVPQVRIDQPQGRVVIMQNQAIDIRGSATDVSGVRRVELWIDGQLITARESSPQQFTFRWSSDHIGDHDVWVRALSNSGGVADSNHVTIGIADDNPPDLKVRLTQNPVAFGTPVKWHIKAYDSKGVTRIRVLVEGNPIKTWDAPDPNVGQTSVDITPKWDPPAPGTYNINVEAWDTVGKYSISPLEILTVQ